MPLPATYTMYLPIHLCVNTGCVVHLYFVLSCLVCSVFNIANLCLCNDDHHNRSVVYVCLDIFESLIFQLPCAHHVLETSCLGGFVYHMCCQFELLLWRLL